MSLVQKQGKGLFLCQRMDTHESTCCPEWPWVGPLHRVLFSGEGRGGGGILADWVRLCCLGSSLRPSISAHSLLLPSWMEASCSPMRRHRPSRFSLRVLVAGLLDSASYQQVNAKHKGKGEEKRLDFTFYPEWALLVILPSEFIFPLTMSLLFWILCTYFFFFSE